MADSTETKAEKFVRLKEARLGKVLDGMRILKNTANPKDYEYTEDQALEVIAALTESVDDLSESFGLQPLTSSETRTTPETPLAETPATEADEKQGRPGNWRDRSNLDPEGVQSPIQQIDGKPLKVKPGDWDDLMLIRVGPHLGLAMEAVMDGDNKTALELLKKVMTA